MKHETEKWCVATELQARKAIINRKKRHFTCVRSSHVAKECKSKISCFIFKNHAALCAQMIKKKKIQM